MRVGTGYDVHRLVEGRKLIMGGVDIPSEKGLLGHSDADVLLHAICDALLGAAGLGDIGRHFPDTAPKYKGISSVTLLSETHRLLTDAGFRVNNIDATIVAERPKMAPHIPEMVATIASAVKADRSAVNVKATTTEGLGFVGKSEGIAAYAVCTIREKSARTGVEIIR
jgi:2-C-methyl-D-erythritol 2,4-cyclodiphosphate synthase